MKIIKWALIFLFFLIYISFSQTQKPNLMGRIEIDSTKRKTALDSSKIILRNHQFQNSNPRFGRRFVDNDSDGINDNRCRGFGFRKRWRKGRR